MSVKETDNEKLILEAAEAEFLEKGYGKSRTTEIAKRAGLNHAMLHYYFRTKENLFEVVFRKKAELMSEIILFRLKQDLPFLEKIKKGIEDHFDFIATNDKLPNFIFSEIRSDESLRNLFIGIVKERAVLLVENLKKEMEAEAKKGVISYMEPYDLLLSILSLNAFVFMSAPIISGITNMKGEQFTMFLEHRKQLNVEIILNQLKL